MTSHRTVLVASAVLALSACTRQAGVPAPSQPRVTSEAGALEGRVDSATGVLVFEGIPFAAPPVGEWRWRPPQPVSAWQGVRPATRLAHNCMQHRPYG